RLLERGCLTLAERCVRGITANEEVAKHYVTNSIGLVSYLSPFIGHHYGDLVGKECARSGRGVREVVLEMGLMSEAQLDEVLSMSNLMQEPHHGDAPADDPSVIAPTADDAGSPRSAG
ncbi:MAG TPA: aspartate ammonia-lyase, partial [Actinomycetaceae bacterium]|nr:aspartate ammonia-lyase [Actinomycetaceae bacterium]